MAVVLEWVESGQDFPPAVGTLAAGRVADALAVLPEG
jgi:hypothetical protein